jgi:hypothetical protein
MMTKSASRAPPHAMTLELHHFIANGPRVFHGYSGRSWVQSRRQSDSEPPLIRPLVSWELHGPATAKWDEERGTVRFIHEGGEAPSLVLLYLKDHPRVISASPPRASSSPRANGESSITAPPHLNVTAYLRHPRDLSWALWYRLELPQRLERLRYPSHDIEVTVGSNTPSIPVTRLAHWATPDHLHLLAPYDESPGLHIPAFGASREFLDRWQRPLHLHNNANPPLPVAVIPRLDDDEGILRRVRWLHVGFNETITLGDLHDLAYRTLVTAGKPPATGSRDLYVFSGTPTLLTLGGQIDRDPEWEDAPLLCALVGGACTMEQVVALWAKCGAARGWWRWVDQRWKEQVPRDELAAGELYAYIR